MADTPSNNVSWIVRCPGCGSTYSVVPDQLKMAQGWLRCGQCQHAFDSTGLVVAWPIPAEPAVAFSVDAGRSDRLLLDEFLKQEDRSPATGPSAEIVSSFEQALATFKPQALPTADLPDPSEEDAPDAVAQPTERNKGWWVTTGAWLLALALALQWVWIERHALATTVPYADVLWRETCRMLGCDVSAPKVKNAIVIQNSSLTPTDGGGAWLTWTWRNTSPHTVQVPALELTLLNAQDQAVLRRVILPAEMEAPASLSSAQVWSGKLHLVTVSGPTSSGYRLLSFYP